MERISRVDCLNQDQDSRRYQGGPHQKSLFLIHSGGLGSGIRVATRLAGRDRIHHSRNEILREAGREEDGLTGTGKDLPGKLRFRFRELLYSR